MLDMVSFYSPLLSCIPSVTERENQKSCNRGWYFFSRDIDKGELILTEKALGCGPNHTLEAWHCLDCLKPMEQLNRYYTIR